MNLKILAIGFTALCCIELALAVLQDDQDTTPQPTRRKKATLLRPHPSSPSRSRSKSPRRIRSSPKPKSEPSAGFTNPPAPASLPNENAQLSAMLSSLGLLSGQKNEQPKNAKLVPGIPIQRADKSVVVEGKNGNILINGRVYYPTDPVFTKKGVVDIKIRGGNFYVNDNLVLKKGPDDLYGIVYYSTHDLYYKGVGSFTLKIDPNGFLHYKDNKNPSLNVNYFIKLYF